MDKRNPNLTLLVQCSDPGFKRFSQCCNGVREVEVRAQLGPALAQHLDRSGHPNPEETLNGSESQETTRTVDHLRSKGAPSGDF